MDFDALLTEAYNRIYRKPLLREIEGDYLVMGDIHGEILSLDYAIKLREKLDAKYLLLLGDYVDRGPDSVECVRRIAELTINDKYAIVLRGNHESRHTYTKYGYQKDLEKINNNGITSDNLFSKLPIVAMDRDYVFLHGFFDESMIGIDTLRSLPDTTAFRRVDGITMSDNYPEIKQLLWNDPNFDGKMMNKKASMRGLNVFEIGENITTAYLNKLGRKMVVRAHTFTGEGYMYIQNNKVLSIFSSSNAINYAHIHGDKIDMYEFES